jgi:hypothetical protein
MKLSWVMLLNDPAKKVSRFRILALFPVVVVPASPGMFAPVMAPAGIGAAEASPPKARGIVVLPMPASYPTE